MNRSLIESGCSYVCKDGSDARRVDAVSGGRVFYRSKRMFYVLPFSTTLERFASWAYERQEMAEARRQRSQ